MKKIILSVVLLFFPFLISAAQIDTTNKFGFLSAGLDKANFDYLAEVGAGWLRPHPGPAVWEIIQENKNADYDWDLMDESINKIENHNINMLITIWPFADWDQIDRNNADACRVSDEDEFLPNEKAEKKGRTEYLPHYRCNPHDWPAYTAWVTALIERYDGDGLNDMPDLAYPIKYWEVMNEPELTGSETLDFYKQDEDAYYQLLKKTYQAIQAADPEAKTVIAGAAGGNSTFLGFYRRMFNKHPQAKKYFNIGNVHCISNDSLGSFNVRPYKRMLNHYHINKPIWVTEAQAIISDDPEINYQQTSDSTKKALSLGVKKIFYTQYTFADFDVEQTNAALLYAQNKYKQIIELYN